MTSRPYDRRSPTASPAQSKITYLTRCVPPTSPIQTSDLDAEISQAPYTDVDIPPDRPGLPTYAEYKRIEAAYLHSLSPRKRDKALITQAMFDKIWDVLHQPDACTIDTPQFRFWVRKMFTLARPAGVDGGYNWGGAEARTAAVHLTPGANTDTDEADLELERSMGIGIRTATAEELSFTAVVLHEDRPVAIMEQLYELFCYCHVRAGHGGRDKTCAVIREHYSWVPKELTAQFVKACPTCVSKRSGHIAFGVIGMDIGIAHRRVSRGRKSGRAAQSERLEETSAPARTPSLGWPTTGGPLDPANPEPCGMRERERLRAQENARRSVSIQSPVSPALDSRSQSVTSEGSCSGGWWGSVPHALTLDASPFRSRNAICSPGHLLSAKKTLEGKENCSPGKTQLPSLASALSNHSLDDHVNLAGAGPSDGAECLLPLALRPLRLLGPVSSNTESDLVGPPSPHPFQIDPVLLSFNYPGPSPSSEPGLASNAERDAVSLGLRKDVSGTQGALKGLSSQGLCRLRSSDVDLRLPALELSPSPSCGLDSPDSSFEQTNAYTAADGAAAATLPFSLSMEFMAKGRCGSRYGYRDSPLGMLYHCPVDEISQEFDGPLRLAVMTDA